MISGIKLSKKPYMKGISSVEILADLDTLKEELPCITHKSATGAVVNKRTFFGDRFTINMIQYDKDFDSGFVIMEDLYSIIREALPDFLHSMSYSGNLIIYSYPNFQEDYRLNTLFDHLMKEIQRIAVFLLKQYGIENRDRIKTLLMDYVETCIEY